MLSTKYNAEFVPQETWTGRRGAGCAQLFVVAPVEVFGSPPPYDRTQYEVPLSRTRIVAAGTSTTESVPLSAVFPGLDGRANSSLVEHVGKKLSENFRSEKSVIISNQIMSANLFGRTSTTNFSRLRLLRHDNIRFCLKLYY